MCEHGEGHVISLTAHALIACASIMEHSCVVRQRALYCDFLKKAPN